jgi:hypothetical protein
MMTIGNTPSTSSQVNTFVYIQHIVWSTTGISTHALKRSLKLSDWYLSWHTERIGINGSTPLYIYLPTLIKFAGSTPLCLPFHTVYICWIHHYTFTFPHCLHLLDPSLYTYLPILFPFAGSTSLDFFTFAGSTPLYLPFHTVYICPPAFVCGPSDASSMFASKQKTHRNHNIRPLKNTQGQKS